ncbi:hypothetical protein FQN52_006447 [Onygenales sp. PD_12]|nr:hypothetical protein FQN52_006447 [Onygenales sp. PD_12]
MSAICYRAVFAVLGAVLVLVPSRVCSLAPSDSWRDADIGQSSYLGPGHDMNPDIVDSDAFVRLWDVGFNASEKVKTQCRFRYGVASASHSKPFQKFYAKPLVYTPLSGDVQLVFIVSTDNIVRTLDANTGDLIHERVVAEPHPQDALYCTEVAEPTDIAYFYAKSYIPNYRLKNETSAIFNGVYYFYAIDITTLEDLPGFPILVDGIPADNDPRKIFIGGTILQRTSLVQVGDFVYAGFGGLCDQFNYTGTILGVDIKSQKVVSNFATQAGPESNFSLDWTAWHAGGAGGIWQSGMGIVSDGDNIYYVTDNGGSSPDHTRPSSGTSSLDLLSETAVKMSISSTGSLELVDYFQPYNYLEDEGFDLGSAGFTILPASSFHTPNYPDLAVVAGKSGKIYILSPSSLGGYGNGPNNTDAALQVLPPLPLPDGGSFSNGFFGGVGAYPLSGDDDVTGGFIYAAAVAQKLVAYEFRVTPSGEVEFVLVGKSVEVSLDRPGIGIPTITTALDSESGRAKTESGIVWLTDPAAGLRAWHAIPSEEGILRSIGLPPVGTTNKFQRPVFGNSRVYIINGEGELICLGVK